MKQWLELASRSDVVRRASRFAVVVGFLLVAINHGGALLRGECDGPRLLKMAMTVTVPYIVSTLSSVAALREHDPAGRRG
ncbi:MAG: nitrate/nitrite transporter NrtS [Candidatus Binatia bacterium]